MVYRKDFGKPELPEQEHGIMSALKKIQENTAFLPDYGFRKPEVKTESAEAEKKEEAWPAVDRGTSVSGNIGSVIVLAAVLLIGFVIKAVRKKAES